MEVGETVTFWRGCPVCKGRGVLTTRPMHPDASMVFHPNNLRQCPRCVEECAKVQAVLPPELTDSCLDCEGVGKYPSGATCKSCGGSGRVLSGDGVPLGTMQ